LCKADGESKRTFPRQTPQRGGGAALDLAADLHFRIGCSRLCRGDGKQTIGSSAGRRGIAFLRDSIPPAALERRRAPVLPEAFIKIGYIEFSNV
jgi:hypothetical protein